MWNRRSLLEDQFGLRCLFGLIWFGCGVGGSGVWVWIGIELWIDLIVDILCLNRWCHRVLEPTELGCVDVSA